MKPVRDIDDPRVAKGLAHPLRVRIMRILEQRTATPKQLAEAVEVNLENVAYHVRTLRKLGLIELQSRKQVGGAVEHHYRAIARPRVSARAWEQMPEIAQQAVIGAALDYVGAVVSSAAAEGRFSRPECHVSRRPLVLDEEGFSQASKIVSAALDELSALEESSRQRIEDGADELDVTMVALLFDTPDVVDTTGNRLGGPRLNRAEGPIT